jgi:hypothetical protein
MIDPVPVPDPESRAEQIARSSDEELEKMREHALTVLRFLDEGYSPECPGYASWGVYLGEIEGEQWKRRRGLPVD